MSFSPGVNLICKCSNISYLSAYFFHPWMLTVETLDWFESLQPCFLQVKRMPFVSASHCFVILGRILFPKVKHLFSENLKKAGHPCNSWCITPLFLLFCLVTYNIQWHVLMVTDAREPPVLAWVGIMSGLKKIQEQAWVFGLCEPAKCMLGYVIRFTRLIVQVKVDMLDHPCCTYVISLFSRCTCVISVMCFSPGVGA